MGRTSGYIVPAAARRALLGVAIVLLGPFSALTETPKPKANTTNLAFVLLSEDRRMLPDKPLPQLSDR